MVNAFDHPSHNSIAESRMESSGEDFRCLRNAPAQAALIWVCFAWQSHFAILALMTLEGIVSQHQRSHRLQKLLPEPPAPSG